MSKRDDDARRETVREAVQAGADVHKAMNEIFSGKRPWRGGSVAEQAWQEVTGRPFPKK